MMFLGLPSMFTLLLKKVFALPCVSNFALITFFLKFVIRRHRRVVSKTSKAIRKKKISNHEKKLIRNS